INLIKQVRRTAGFRINGTISIHVDPGPGALFACRDFGEHAEKTDVIVATHNHIDHMNDTNLIIEAMADGWKVKKKGMFIGSKSVIEGDENNDKGVSKYHLGRMESYKVAEAGKRIDIAVGKGKALLLPTRVKHDDKTGFGFVLDMDGVKIGYTSDTEYFDGISEQYKNCDLLIANCLKPEKDGIPGHLNRDDTVRLLSEAAPKLCVLTHLGMSMLKAGPEKEAAKIEKESKVKTIAAVDGMKIDVKSLKIS
ncbi:MAG: MBL fold metallo-hydrolase, partial [Candidatus Micrarchaeota archaeon]|nr:MBL fold metallo-hydrolase [Candidatus Micrarchaeota archaeon]